MSPPVLRTASREVVLSKARRLLPDRTTDEVLRILDAAVSSAPEADAARVQLAILKLYDVAAGADDLETVARWATDDWRDVLAWAQYPREARRAPAATDKDRAADAAQWQAWLER